MMMMGRRVPALVTSLVFANVLLSSAFTISPFTVRSTRLGESSFEDDFIDKQKTVSSSNKQDAATQSIGRHLKHQREVFDDLSEFFSSEEATPPEVVPVLRYLVKKMLQTMMQGKRDDEKYHVLDVGSGTGALFPFYLQAADEEGIQLEIKGIDLSPKMTECAAQNGKKLVQDSGKHSIQCETGDFVQKIMGVEYCKETLTGFGNGVVDDSTNAFRGEFDAVVINACFGNFLDSGTTGASFVHGRIEYPRMLLIQTLTLYIFTKRFCCYCGSNKPEEWWRFCNQSPFRR